MPDRSDGARSFEAIAVHDHACLLFENRQEQFAALLDFGRIGVQRGEKCLLFLPAESAAGFASWAMDRAPDIGTALAAGAILPSALPGPETRSPTTLLSSLEKAAQAAETEGFSALRLVCDIRFLLGPHPSVRRLLAFEQVLNEFLPRHRALAMCHFDRGALSARVVREALYCHPVLSWKGRTNRNPSFEPPQERGRRDLPAREVEGMLRGLSERRRIETFLSETQARYRNLVEFTPEAILVEVGGRIAWINPAGLDLFGASSPEELLQRPFSALVCPDQRAFLGYPPDGEGETKDFPPCREEALQRLDGRRFVAEIKRLPLLDRDGRAVLVLARDVSEGRRAEIALRRSLAETEEARDLVECILQSVADGVIVTDLRHCVLLMNAAAERMLRVRLPEVKEQPLASVIPDEHLREQFRIFSWQWGTETQQVEFRLPDHRGESRAIQARLSVMRGKKGKKIGVITVLQDVTLQRQFERMKNELISTVAHELRTPLTAVLGFSELLLRQPESFDGCQQQEFLEEIFDKANLLKKLVDDLVDINRFESGHALPLVKSRCALGELLRLKAAVFQARSPGHRLAVELEPEDPGHFWLDPSKMEHVLDNLISNAIKYSPQGSRILLQGQPMGNYYLVCVRDEGVGMSSEQKERIFDKFYRVDTSNTAVGGIGLGMSLVRYIIRAHGGRIWVRSEAGVGTTIFFTLPRQS